MKEFLSGSTEVWSSEHLLVYYCIMYFKTLIIDKTYLIKSNVNGKVPLNFNQPASYQDIFSVEMQNDANVLAIHT